MAALPLLDTPVDLIERRVMFALELIDPVTRQPVCDGLEPSVAGLSPPLRGHSGRFVWLDVDPPAKRDIVVELAIDDPRYGPPADPLALQFSIPPNDRQTRPDELLRRAELTIKARYLPPDGITGAIGMVIEDAGSRTKLQGIEVALAFRYAGNQSYTSPRTAVSDEGGAFTAIADDLGDRIPDPAPPTLQGDILAWLALTRPGTPPATLFTDFLPLRAWRVTQLREAVRWAELRADPPELEDA